jgi:hypothetical protein
VKIAKDAKSDKDKQVFAVFFAHFESFCVRISKVHVRIPAQSFPRRGVPFIKSEEDTRRA